MTERFKKAGTETETLITARSSFMQNDKNYEDLEGSQNADIARSWMKLQDIHYLTVCLLLEPEYIKRHKKVRKILLRNLCVNCRIKTTRESLVAPTRSNH